MDFELSAFERWLSAHEGRVEHDLGHSGIAPRLDYGPMPDPELRSLVASIHGVPEDEVVIAAGATEANFLACAAVLRPGDVVAVETPTYPPLALAPEFVGGAVRRFARTWATGFEAPIAPETAARITIYSSPHNPSGRRVPPEVVFETAQGTSGYVLVDEVFREIAEDPWPTARRAHPRALATGSLTKGRGFPGLRIGWLFAPQPVAERARAIRNFVSLSTGALDEQLAVRALREPATRAAEARTRNIPLVQATLDRLGLPWIRPEAGATCVVAVDDDMAWGEALAQSGILVIPGTLMGLPGALRVGFGGPHDKVRSALAAFERVARDRRPSREGPAAAARPRSPPL
ncbi:MAG: aminotransferase class I/II-fold pyridoxal phosphate-dependent enzyme [Thermoplasmatota archaeon]